MLDFISILENTELFKDISMSTINHLFVQDSFNIKTYKKNSVIYFQNEKCVTFDIVLKGIVSVQSTDEKGNYI